MSAEVIAMYGVCVGASAMKVVTVWVVFFSISSIGSLFLMIVTLKLDKTHSTLDERLKTDLETIERIHRNDRQGEYINDRQGENIHDRHVRDTGPVAELGTDATRNVSEVENKKEKINSAHAHNRLKIFCWTLTAPNNHATRAVAIKETWAKRCDKHVFYSSVHDDSLPTVSLKVAEGRDHLVEKYWKAYSHSFERYYKDYDWFVKADDDTFIVVENARNMVSRYDPQTAIVLGYKFEANVSGGYMSGGAGIIFSKEAYRRLVVEGIKKHRCKPETKSADVETGRCLNMLGVSQGVSLDKQGRQSFHPMPLRFHLIGKMPDWMKRISFHKLQKGWACCSKESISFHYVTPEVMYMLDFIIYGLSVHGMAKDPDSSAFGEALTHAPIRISSWNSHVDVNIKATPKLMEGSKFKATRKETIRTKMKNDESVQHVFNLPQAQDGA